MSVAEAMERIEGHSFSAMVNLASDLRTFLRILVAQPEFQTLHAEMHSDEVTWRILNRLLDLAASPIDDAHEHPADTAMAAYLTLLSTKAPEYSKIAAETVLGCKQCWWARQIADNLQTASRFHSHAPIVRKVLLTCETEINYTATVNLVGSSVHTPFQVAGQIKRSRQPREANGLRVYPVAISEWPDLFKNHQTRHQLTKVVTGKEP